MFFKWISELKSVPSDFQVRCSLCSLWKQHCKGSCEYLPLQLVADPNLSAHLTPAAGLAPLGAGMAPLGAGLAHPGAGLAPPGAPPAGSGVVPVCLPLPQVPFFFLFLVLLLKNKSINKVHDLYAYKAYSYCS